MILLPQIRNLPKTETRRSTVGEITIVMYTETRKNIDDLDAIYATVFLWGGK